MRPAVTVSMVLPLAALAMVFSVAACEGDGEGHHHGKNDNDDDNRGSGLVFPSQVDEGGSGVGRVSDDAGLPPPAAPGRTPAAPEVGTGDAGGD